MNQSKPAFVPGLEGVVAFHTAIAEPDKDGGSLRYRGVDIEDLVGHVGFDDVWGLLVDDAFGNELPYDVSVPAQRSGNVRIDVQAADSAAGRGPGLRAHPGLHRRRDQGAGGGHHGGRAHLCRPVRPRGPA